MPHNGSISFGKGHIDGLKIGSFEFRVSGFEFRVSGFRFQVSSFKFQVSKLLVGELLQPETQKPHVVSSKARNLIG